jgi:hypothetical protein
VFSGHQRDLGSAGPITHLIDLDGSARSRGLAARLTSAGQSENQRGEARDEENRYRFHKTSF